MSARAAIGIDVGGTATKGGIVDADGTVLARTERPTDVGAGTKGIVATVEELLARAGDISATIEAVGVGAAGFIDLERGAITFSPNLVYDDPLIADAIKARFRLPAILENDASAAAWGERSFGTAQGADYVVMLTLGTGIGSGIIVDGRLLRGSTGAGAELGHTVIDTSGPECPCGLRGCFEQLASGTAIARMAREWTATDPQSSILSFAGTSEQINAEHVAKAAREYDETARSILREAGKALGVGLSNIANIFDPEVIVLGGSVISAGESYLGPARDELARMSLAQRRRPMRLDVTALGNDAGIVGAATLALNEVS